MILFGQVHWGMLWNMKMNAFTLHFTLSFSEMIGFPNSMFVLIQSLLIQL